MVYETQMLTIGQLARMLDSNPQTLRYYERIGLLIPSARTAAGYRLYSQLEADRLAFIRRAQRLGWSLHEIASIIAVRESGVPPCRHVRSLAEAKAREIEARITELSALRQEMVQLARVAVEVESECADSSSICLAFDPGRSTIT
ncbi:MAG TPA: heavy metal-responsive transcriptional regulator [Ktedonobacterales bacterium]|jgi:DNA-binding transcriptional MerR regulator|nr:heavy metal-responsive transcriptional regulator [Ktedonobacterales bacterium]